MLINYNDGVLKIYYKGNNPEGILKLIVDYEESKYKDYQMVVPLENPIDYFGKDITGHMHE